MLSVRFFKKLFLIFLVLRVSAQRATTPHPIAVHRQQQQQQQLTADTEDYPMANNPFEAIRQQEQARLLEANAGSGNVLATAEIVLAALSSTFPYADTEQRHNFGGNGRRVKTDFSTLRNIARPLAKQKRRSCEQTDDSIDADRKQLSNEIAAVAYPRAGLDENNGSGSSDENAITTESGSGNESGSAGVGTTDDGVNYDGTISSHTKDAPIVQSAGAQAASVDRRLWQAIANYYDLQQAQSTNKATDSLTYAEVKRAPQPIGGYATRRDYTWSGNADSLEQPRYPYAYMLPDNGAAERQTAPLHTPWRSYKREKSRDSREAIKFLPSISSGAMTSLGDFFRDLTKNVHFTEKSQLGKAEEKLLDGEHPLRMLHEGIPDEHAHPGKTAQFLHALRTYRPSQKIRSLVAMNPYGYKGSQFIDPNYMWVGLGK